MRSSQRLQLKVNSRKAPTVELDSEAPAAYVRFSDRKVFRTLVVPGGGELITVDLAADDSVIGVEVIGLTEFTITKILKKTPISAPPELLSRARYLPARRAELAPAC